MKKTLKSMISAAMALTMLGSTAVSVSAYDPAYTDYNDEEIQFMVDWLTAIGEAENLSDFELELVTNTWGDKDYPNPNNGKESEILPAWYIPGEPIPDWVIGEYFERCCPDNENYTDRYKNAFEAVCNASGVTKEDVVEDVNIRDSISLRDDVDFDGEVTIKDLTVVKKHLIKDIELTPIQKFALNDDSSVTIKDVARISQKLVKSVD